MERAALLYNGCHPRSPVVLSGAEDRLPSSRILGLTTKEAGVLVVGAWCHPHGEQWEGSRHFERGYLCQGCKCFHFNQKAITVVLKGGSSFFVEHGQLLWQEIFL